MLGRADAGDLQNMRRVDGAAGQDDLAGGAHLAIDAVLAKRDTDAATPLKQQTRRDGIGLNLEIAAAARFAQKGLRRGAAPFAATGHLRIRDAFLLLAVVVGGEREASLLRRFDKAMSQGQDRAVILDDQRTALAAVGRITIAAIRLGFTEERQHLVIAPAAAAHLRPIVVIGRIAADIEHAVNRAGAPEGFAARPLQLAAGRAGLAFTEEVPVDLGVVEDAQHAGRHMDPDVAVGRASFEQHTPRPILGEPARAHPAGRAGPDNNVIRVHDFLTPLDRADSYT